MLISFPACLLQDAHSQVEAREDLAALASTRSKTRARATLDDLLDTLKLLEEEPEPLLHPKAYRQDRYAWMDEVSRGSREASTASRSGKAWVTMFLP